MKMPIEHAHKSRTVCARFAVHNSRIFERFKECLRAFNRFNRMDIARIDAKIDEGDAMFFARFLFEQVIPLWRAAAQVQNGFNPLFGKLLNPLWRRLVLAVHSATQLMPIGKPQA